MLDSEQTLNNVIIGSCNLASAADNGFAVTDESICLLNAMVILAHEKEVICDELTDEQIENLGSVFNAISNTYMFTEQNDENYYDFIFKHQLKV